MLSTHVAEEHTNLAPAVLDDDRSAATEEDVMAVLRESDDPFTVGKAATLQVGRLLANVIRIGEWFETCFPFPREFRRTAVVDAEHRIEQDSNRQTGCHDKQSENSEQQEDGSSSHGWLIPLAFLAGDW